MALTLGESNSSFHKSLQYLNDTRAKIDKSQLRLSSGNKIVSPADDAGGLSVAMKLQHQLVTTNAMVSGVSNAVSYTEMQSSVLTTAKSIIDEMRTLQSKYKLSSDDDTKSVYETSYNELLDQLKSLPAESFNGETLFNREEKVTTSSTGSYITMDAIEITFDATNDAGANLSADGSNALNLAAASLGSIRHGNVEAALSIAAGNISNYMIQVGSDMSALGFATDYLSNMATNIEAAHGRIMDVDVAEETINLSKLNLQHEAALAAIVQANLAMESVLELLISRND
jgi:flagellin